MRKYSEMYSLVDYICIFGEVFSVFLYIYVLFRLFTTSNTNFKSPFFMLFIACAFTDIVSAVGNAMVRHMFTYTNEFLGDDGKLFNIVYVICYLAVGFTYNSHLFINFLVSLNRFTSVVLPTTHQKFWTNRRCGSLIFGQYILAVACIGYVVFAPPVTEFDPSVNEVQFIDFPVEYIRAIHIISGSNCIITELANLCLSLLTVYHLMKAHFHRRQNMERNLSIHAVLSFCGGLLMASQTIIKLFASFTENAVLMLCICSQSFWINDIFIFFNLYSIILCSSQLRTLIFSGYSSNSFSIQTLKEKSPSNLRSIRKSII